MLVMLGLPVALWLFSLLAGAAQQSSAWQDEVRKCADTQDWACALALVEREVARAPRDMDVRAWRARVLLWSGKLAEAEAEYDRILTAVPNDPDYWLGVSQVYSREGRTQEALQALDRAVALDPKRADLGVARAAALRALGAQREAKLELDRALQLDATMQRGASLCVLSATNSNTNCAWG
jgi:tetratricopeptide (TPR) repeat protein